MCQRLHTEENTMITRELQKLEENSPKHTTVDLTKMHLTESSIELLHKKICKNSIVGNILWPQNIQNGAFQKLKSKIEAKLIQNNENYKFHPTSFIHGLLSSHVYNNFKVGDGVTFPNVEHQYRNEFLKNWKVAKLFEDSTSGYYGAIYVNHADHQIVLAHRGTLMCPKDLIALDSPLKTDIDGILFGGIVRQQVYAYIATHEACELAKKNSYGLSTTGHSLGGWLAELSAFFCKKDFKCDNVQTVTFDSPGAFTHMRNARSNVINRETTFKMKDLDIINFLSAPNLVNCCNKHVGRSYRLFPNILTIDDIKSKIIKKLPQFLGKILDEIIKEGLQNSHFHINGVLSVSGHSLDKLLETFDRQTHKPKKVVKVVDWPKLEHKFEDRANFVNKGSISKIVNEILSKMPCISKLPFKGSISYLAGRIIPEIGFFSIINVLLEYARGNIRKEQLMSTIYHMEGQNYEIKENIKIDEKFMLSYKGHYREVPIDRKRDLLATQNKGHHSDWYLNKIKQISFNTDTLLVRQLKSIKKLYCIKLEYGGKYIYATSDKNIEEIRQHMNRLVAIHADMYGLVMEMSKRLYEGDHPAITSSLNNVGNAYRAIGNPRKAIEYREKALSSLNSQQPTNYPAEVRKLFLQGKNCYDNGHFDEALKSLREAGEKGHAEAMYLVGVCYQKGQGVEKSLQFANFWFLQASQKEYVEAFNALGDCYRELGKRVKSEYEVTICKNIAATYYRKAAVKGNGSLGNAYRAIGTSKKSHRIL